MTQILICTPAPLRTDANALMSALGNGPEDGHTFDALGFSHDTGSYAVAAFRASDTWLSRLPAPLAPPDWAVDMDAATRAQAALKIQKAADTATLPQAGSILVILGASGRGMLDRLGLTSIDNDIQPPD